MNKYAVMNTVFSVLGGVIVGGVATFLVTKKHFDDYAMEEIEKVRHHYALIRKDQNVVSIFSDLPTQDDTAEEDESDSVRESATNLIRDLGYRDAIEIDEYGDKEWSPDEEEESPDSTTSIFDKAVSEDEVGEEVDSPRSQTTPTKSGRKKVVVTGRESDPESEASPYANSEDPRLRDYVRRDGEPYIISQDEMFNTKTEWEKPTLSYYEDDDTLVDERNVILDETHRQRYVGERHLSMFGVLSEDKNIVYVRSPQISSDFEVILEPGKYSVRVLGEPDYEAAEKQQLRRMRASD